MPEITVKAERETRSGITVLTVDVGDGKLEQRRYRAVLGGLSWPTPSSHAYYLLVAEPATDESLATRFEGISIPRGKLRVLCERSLDSPFLNELAEKLSDDCARFGCTTVYCEIVVGDDGRYDERATLMRELLTATKRPVSIMKAPFTDDAKSARREALQLGLSIVQHWLREAKLELPEESLAREQLRATTREDLDDPEAEPRLFAARALGFVVSAFHKLGGFRGIYTPKRERRPQRFFGNRR